MIHNDKDTESWANELGHRIHGCEICQYFGGDTNLLSDHIPLSEFLEANNVPKKLHEAIIEYLSCSCGNELNLSTLIVVDSFEVELDEYGGDRFGHWEVEDNPRINEFVKVLKSSPKSAASHELAIEILKQLGGYPTCEVLGHWWRGQSLSNKDCPPGIERLGPPPDSKRSDGRFNCADQPAFYLASERDSAIAEATKYRKLGEEIWVLQFCIEKIDKIVNLVAPSVRTDSFRKSWIPDLFAGLLWSDGLVHQDNDGISDTYLLAQFITKTAISLGIKGFKVNSKLHVGTNLILFTWDEKKVIPVGEPKFCKLKV